MMMMIMIDDVTSIFVIDNAEEWTMRVTSSAVVGSSDPSLIIIVEALGLYRQQLLLEDGF